MSVTWRLRQFSPMCDIASAALTAVIITATIAPLINAIPETHRISTLGIYGEYFQEVGWKLISHTYPDHDYSSWWRRKDSNLDGLADLWVTARYPPEWMSSPK